jgi:preprotein translocase subunit SecD
VLKNLRWRGVIVLVLILMAFLYLTPTLSGKLPEWWSGILPQEKVHLGLDLQGGIHLILGVEVDKAVENALDMDLEGLRTDLRERNIRFQELRRQGIEGIAVTLMRERDEEVLQELVATRYREYRKEPDPSKEGTSYRLVLNSEAKTQVRQMAADQVLKSVRNRIDQFGVSEPDIRPQEDYRLLIQLPGVKDPDRAMALINQQALLEFKLVDESMTAKAALDGTIPPGSEILYEVSANPDTGELIKTTPILLKKRTLLTGEYVKDASVRFDQYSEPYVSLSFDSKGARQFARITEENVGKRLAIVLDNNVHSAPVIREPIPSGDAMISGSYTIDTARDLAIVLRAGALPAPVKTLEERTVGPSLGQDSIDKGRNSMIVGGVIVLVFMIIYYGFAGLIADLAVLLNILFIMAALAGLEATLTLPGIAGMILTVGMAVDANVLIFERIREELRLGKPPRAAIEGGYGKALVTILDANVTTLIVALVLFQFGTGPIRGFAVTLSIGIVASLITAIFVTRVVFDYLYVYRRWKKVSI